MATLNHHAELDFNIDYENLPPLIIDGEEVVFLSGERKDYEGQVRHKGKVHDWKDFLNEHFPIPKKETEEEKREREMVEEAGPLGGVMQGFTTVEKIV